MGIMKTSFLTVVLLCLLVQYSLAESFSKSKAKTVSEAIRNRGYQCEEHHVTTKDGYILTLHRIPRKYFWPKAKPVIMQHGILSSAFAWTIETPHKSPAFLLHDAGFDVWLPNIRGSVYSRNHTHFDPDSYDFWNFSWDEMAEFDFPAIIDYVLRETGESKLFYIGHSMGTTIFFCGMNYDPSYNSKIRSMYALAPVASVAHLQSELRVFSYVEGIIKKTMNMFHMYELLPENGILMDLTRLSCNHFKITEFGCSNLLFLVTGFESEQFDYDWLSMATDQLLSGTSVNTIIHYGQEYRSGLFRKYDYGYDENKKRYNHHEPPNYDLSLVTSTVNLVWGQNDYITDPKDVQFLIKNLAKVGRITGAVQNPKFNHLDFLWSPEAKKLIYDKVISDMRNS